MWPPLQPGFSRTDAPPLQRETTEEREPQSHSDASLVVRARAGDRDAWSALVDRFAPLVWSIVTTMGLRAEEAEDAFQQTWASLCAQIGGIRHPGSIAGWIATSARREAWRLRRARSEDARLEEQALEDSIDPHALCSEWERSRKVRAAMEQLPPRCRALLRRMYFESEDRTYGDLARDLGMPLGSVGPTRIRCLARLGRLLERGGFS